MEMLKENEVMINGKSVDVLFSEIEKLYEKGSDHETKKISTTDCPVCGAKDAMSYVFSLANGHVHASCTACHIAMMQ